MTKRLFVAINISDHTKDVLSANQDRSVNKDVKWTKPENFHFTINFLGVTDINDLLKIADTLREIAGQAQEFDLEYKELAFAPPNKTKPTMIWAVFNSNDFFDELVENINEEMLKILSTYSSGRKEQTPHITLARFKGADVPKSIQLVKSKKGLKSIHVSSIELMESELNSSGPIYTILESFPFG